MILKKKYSVMTPIISNSSLHQTASSSESVTSIPLKRKLLMLNTSIKNIKTEPKSSLPIIEGKNVLIGKTTYKIVSMPPSKMKAVVFGTNLPGKKPSTELIKVCTIHQYIIFLLTLKNTYFDNILLDCAYII